MPPKKAISKSESVSETGVTETVIKTKSKKVAAENVEEKVKKPKTKKTAEVAEPEKVEEKVKKTRTKKTAEAVEPETVVEETKKTKIKKVAESEKLKKIQENTLDDVPETTQDISILPKIESAEYNALKVEWVGLCEKIKEANREKELLETQKNQLLNKLWKLGETSYPKANIFETTDKIKPINITKASSIQTKILDNDSSDDSNSASSDDSDSESEKPKKTKIITKKSAKVESDTSDSDSN